jgi:GT2 family glycosyltransferase
MNLPVSMDLSIVIVNWNSKEFLRKCVASVSAQTAGISYEIIVIDSGSFDGSGEMLSQFFPNVRFIQSESNIGFARANNEAFKASVGEHVLFLNPDTELVGPAINIMLQQLKALPDAGAVGCRLLNGDGSLQSTCIQALPTICSQFINSELLRKAYPQWSVWGMAALFDGTDRPTKVQAISGACVMLPRLVFEQAGRFSEDYFMYAEDIDLCHKVRLSGHANYYLPHATVIHFGGGSSEKAPSEFSVVMMRESIWRFLHKTRGGLYALAYRMSTFFLSLVRLLALFALWPIHLIQQRSGSWTASFRKWRAILGWSLGIKPASAYRR